MKMGGERSRRAASAVLVLVVLVSAFAALATPARGQDFVSEDFDLMESIPGVDYEQNFPMTGTGFVTNVGNPVEVSQNQAHSGSQSVLFNAKYDAFSYVGVYNNGYLSFWFYLTNTSTIQPTYTIRVDSTLAASGYDVLTIARTGGSTAHFVLQSNEWDSTNGTLRAIADVPTSTWTKVTFELNDTTEVIEESSKYIWGIWLNDESVGTTSIQVDPDSMGYLETSTFKMTITRTGTTGTGAPFYLDDFGTSDTSPVASDPLPPDATFLPSVATGIAPLETTFHPLYIDLEAYAWDFGDGNTSTEVEPTHTFELPGIYNVTLNVTNGGLYDENWLLITATLEPAITSTPDVNGTIGSVYSYAPVCNNEVTEWTIQTNATFLEINATTGLVSGPIGPEDAGWYGVLIYADTDPVCHQEFILWVSPLEWEETITVGVNINGLRASVSYALSDPSLGWAVKSVSWDFGDGSINQTGATASHTYAKAGTYAVTCTVTNILDDDTVGTREVTVKKVATTPAPSTSDESGGGDTTEKRSSWLLVLPLSALFLLVALALSGKNKATRRRGRR
jgi:PKD repeat protein